MRRMLVILLCLGLASCKKNEFGEYPPFPVSGQVLVNGKPAKGVMVVFYLKGYNGEKSIVPQGYTDEAGNFVLSTYGVNDGAPAGDFEVSLRWFPSGGGIRSGKDKFEGKFADPAKSGIVAHVDKVDKGKNELKPFELQVEGLDSKAPRPISKKQFPGAP